MVRKKNVQQSGGLGMHRRKNRDRFLIFIWLASVWLVWKMNAYNFSHARVHLGWNIFLKLKLLKSYAKIISPDLDFMSVSPN